MNDKKLIIPMIISARKLNETISVPVLNPDYTSALRSYLGKDSSPPAFNTGRKLKKGIHLHFILPSMLKRGVEITQNGVTRFEYPAVPDRFAVTRMYVDKNGKIVSNCSIVESNFISLDDRYYDDSISVPKFDWLESGERFRYMGRKYSYGKPPPLTQDNKCGYIDKITAMGAGDPMFSAYYPSCSSVFGFHDSLTAVPSNAIVSYFVVGYYSNPNNDPFNHIETPADMEAALSKHELSMAEISVCNSCILFGATGGISVSRDYEIPTGEINIGIGKSSAEALSAVIKRICSESKDDDLKHAPDLERFLTSLQYDTAYECTQPDGDFKIDDDIHFRGFTVEDALENAYSLKLEPCTQNSASKADCEPLIREYSNLLQFESKLGSLRRSLEYKKNSLYYLWEMYEDAIDEKKPPIQKHINALIDEISDLRKNISERSENSAKMRDKLSHKLKPLNCDLEQTASEPFYFPKDPAIALFGEGMKRTYAFGEDGRFESDNTLFCLTQPLKSNSGSSILECFTALPNPFTGYSECAVMAVLLDKSMQSKLGLTENPQSKHSPIMFNETPLESITLFMQWETCFYPNYNGAVPHNSKFEYGNVDYVYKGEVSKSEILCNGVSILTPHGVYNLQNKLAKYLKFLDDTGKTSQVNKLINKIKDMSFVSQSLGGFNIALTGLKYAFQFPIDIDPNDTFSKKVADIISGANSNFNEPESERFAVRNNAELFPLREGYMTLPQLAIVDTFGGQRRIIKDCSGFSGRRDISENLPKMTIGKSDGCLFPLAFTSAARLSAEFVTAADVKVLSSPFADATPIIAIFMPDMLNRNLNVFSSKGENIGIIKTAYRKKDGKTVAVGRFVRMPSAPADIDARITNFINAVTCNNTAFSELMETIDEKLNRTLSLSRNDFIFGRALVLAEVKIDFKFYGGAEWSKKDCDIGKFNDCGLSKQEFPVMFGDRERATDGVCCGFYGGFEQGFAAFGLEKRNAQYLNAPAFTIKAADEPKNVTLLFDPMLSVTINTGFLPVKQLRMYGEHTDFSKFQLLTAELNTVLSNEKNAQLPEFSQAVFERLYPVYNRQSKETTYNKIDIVPPVNSIEAIGNVIITDGVICSISQVADEMGGSENG